MKEVEKPNEVLKQAQEEPQAQKGKKEKKEESQIKTQTNNKNIFSKKDNWEKKFITQEINKVNDNKRKLRNALEEMKVKDKTSFKKKKLPIGLTQIIKVEEDFVQISKKIKNEEYLKYIKNKFEKKDLPWNIIKKKTKRILPSSPCPASGVCISSNCLNYAHPSGNATYNSPGTSCPGAAVDCEDIYWPRAPGNIWTATQSLGDCSGMGMGMTTYCSRPIWSVGWISNAAAWTQATCNQVPKTSDCYNLAKGVCVNNSCISTVSQHVNGFACNNTPKTPSGPTDSPICEKLYLGPSFVAATKSLGLCNKDGKCYRETAGPSFYPDPAWINPAYTIPGDTVQCTYRPTIEGMRCTDPDIGGLCCKTSPTTASCRTPTKPQINGSDCDPAYLSPASACCSPDTDSTYCGNPFKTYVMTDGSPWSYCTGMGCGGPSCPGGTDGYCNAVQQNGWKRDICRNTTMSGISGNKCVSGQLNNNSPGMDDPLYTTPASYLNCPCCQTCAAPNVCCNNYCVTPTRDGFCEGVYCTETPPAADFITQCCEMSGPTGPTSIVDAKQCGTWFGTNAPWAGPSNDFPPYVPLKNSGCGMGNPNCTPSNEAKNSCVDTVGNKVRADYKCNSSTTYGDQRYKNCPCCNPCFAPTPAPNCSACGICQNNPSGYCSNVECSATTSCAIPNPSATQSCWNDWGCWKKCGGKKENNGDRHCYYYGMSDVKIFILFIL